MAIRLGDPFPDFSAQTNESGIRSFHEWMGDSWAILFSHPADFTPVCTTELARAAELADEFEKRNVKLIALSSDSAESHRKWIEDICAFSKQNSLTKDSFPFPIIADEERVLIKKFGMEDVDEKNSEGIPLAARAVFVVGQDKKLKLSILYPATTGRNFDEIIRVVDSLQLTANQKLATPANWHVGDSCMLNPKMSDQEAESDFSPFESVNLPSGKSYIRMTNKTS
ncbi:1-Cys peroxiredoxin [Aphelenchoides besseyi]|nr:1-Cys peroxiredoxin [Aphelenchoides besseyi]KAI6195241.1 1-Cys peroxiredoxin [Aphelenchoides besseyi]